MPAGERLFRMDFRQLLDKLPAAAYSCDTHGLIQYFNQRAVELWGREPMLNDSTDRFCGSWKLFSADGTPIEHEKCGMALTLESNREYLGREIIIQRPDGTRRRALAHVTPIRDDRGEVAGALNILLDVTDHKQVESERRESEERLRAVIDTAVDGIITIDENGLVQSLNPATVTLFGYEPEEVIGNNVSMLMPEPYQTEHDRYLSNYLTTGSRKIIGIGREVEGRRKDGSTFPMYLAVGETLLGDGRLFTGIVRDMSERRRAEEALREADRRKDDFLAMLAHELRNPLTPLRTSLALMRMTRFEPSTVAESHEMMERQVEHLTRLVDDLLDVSRISHGKLQLHRECIDLTTVLQRALDEVRNTITEAGHELVVAIPDERIFLDADPVRLNQMFTNLLSNAAKYTPTGGRIELSAERNGEGVRLSVQDNGIGVPPDRLDSIFEMFGQLDRSLETGSPGLGIGLSLVKSIVEMHGGRVHASSEGLDRGSEFSVFLPTVEATEQESMALRQEVAGNDGSGRRCSVLIVDDDRDVAHALSRFVRLLGHEVCVAEDGQRAIELAEETRPDVVLMDIGLPRMNGYDAGAWIREQSWGRQIVLVAVTGWGQEDDRRHSREAGFDHHFTKPVDVDELHSLLDAVGSKR